MQVFEFITGFSNGTGGRKSSFWEAEENAKKAAQKAVRNFTKENGHKFARVRPDELKEGWLAIWASETTKKFFGVRLVKLEDSIETNAVEVVEGETA